MEERIPFGDRLKPWTLSSVGALFTLTQIVLSFVLYDRTGSDAVRNAGWGIIMISALFGWLPIFTLRARGGVEKGRSYVRTTNLVTSGVYALVRHPQFLAGMLLNVALPLIAQHWLIVVLGVPPFVLTLFDARLADRASLEKFGEDYKHYMEEVPRLNFLLGIAHWLTRIRRDSCPRKN